MQKFVRNKILYAVFITALISCSKDAAVSIDTLYGKWKIGYGDTITFANKNGVNIATFRTNPNALNPNKPRSDRAFTFNNGKLAIQDSVNANYRNFESLTWTEASQSFKISGGDWFPLSVTDLSIITFTRINN